MSCFSQDVFAVFSFSEDFPRANTVLVGITNSIKSRPNICVLLFIEYQYKGNIILTLNISGKRVG
ncbi:MAG: hypothetical protein CMH46_10625 [Muricauda sp.]|nr:hypothetical protein [Allomuricauda sp.]